MTWINKLRRFNFNPASAQGSYRVAALAFCLTPRVRKVATYQGFVAQTMTLAPIKLPAPDDMITQVAVGCGPGRTRINGICVARTTLRQTRRVVRRCVRRQGSTCAPYE